MRRALSRRSLFALPLAVPATALAGASAPAPTKFKTFSFEIEPIKIPIEGWQSAGRVLFREVHDEWAFVDDDGNDWSFAEVARTLGVPYHAPAQFTEDEVAATLGIEASPSQPDPPLV